MAKETITLALEGDVSLVEFAKAISNLNLLLNQLSKEVNRDADVEWIVDELYAGSAVTTLRGVNGDLSSVENVVNAYENIGESLQSGRNINYSTITQRYARDLVSVIDNRVTFVRFETPEKDFVIASRPTKDIQEVIKYAWSSVKGTVETLSHRKRLSFTLWDTLYDRPVSCYFKEGQEDIMRDTWGKKAVVSGRVGRRTETGRPIVIRDVKQIRIVEGLEPGSYRKARGVFPWTPDSELPEDIIGRLRSA
ncbi:MAG: hypothetical protein A2158_06190 [Chloroflexi bacterium RBG_13_46_14]|nr:MAG: hypothetical protein A2158_06190 [Chloroflexi bacterium RBG_13_46_14]